MNNGFLIKALNGDTFTETRIENSKTLMYVYDRSGRLLDVLEEIACYIHPKDVKPAE